MTDAERELCPLERRLPGRDEPCDGDALLEAFLSYAEEKGLELYPAQEEAILELFAGHNVVLNTPTGSGKSLVALAACFKALADGDRAFFTAPIKALVSEKFFDLCATLGPDNVGMMTGDATINHDAPVICCTAEILSNLTLREGDRADVQMIVMDEFHYYGDRDRGVAWQVPLITAPQSRFLLMSATLGEPQRFVDMLDELTGAESALVQTTERPVPLDWTYSEHLLQEAVQDLLNAGKAPVYIVHFSQRAASEQAQTLMSIDFLSKDQKGEIKEQLKGFRFDSPFGAELSRHIRHGIGVHHAGMLPKYRRLVERLAQKGLLKLICGTDTLGVGINIPLRTVMFTQLCKYDGEKTKILSARDFKQIAGRAGRRGFDTQGSVVVQAPEHVIENQRAKARLSDNPKKLKKLRPKKAPERGYVPWDAQTLERLRTAKPERLPSRFAVSSGMLLNVLARQHEDGCRAMARLIRSSHEPKKNQRQHARTAISLYRSLKSANIIELDGDRIAIHADLQEDFSLNRALALYAVESIDALEDDDENYSLTVMTIIEAILEEPHVILRGQVNKLKTELVKQLKAEGVEYDERMEALEKVEYPKPEVDFIYGTYELFKERHPWVAGHRISPKSIARDMYEQGESFNGYVKSLGLQRAEGVLLRYLSSAYRVLEQTVPEQSKSEEVLDLIEWLGAEIRSVDASLLEEWTQMQDPKAVLKHNEEREPDNITTDRKAFTVMIRNAVWRIVQALSRKQYPRVITHLVDLAGEQRFADDGDGQRWTDERVEAAMAPYWAEFEELRTDPKARSPQHLSTDKDGDLWRLRQNLADPDDNFEWTLDLSIDLAECREANALVLRLRAIDQG